MPSKNIDAVDPHRPVEHDLPMFKKETTRNEQIGQLVDFVSGFDGQHYDPKKDKERLTGQMRGVLECLLPGEWLTVSEISSKTNYPEPSVSAQLRNLRKVKFGGLDIPGRYREGTRIFEYRLVKR